MSTEQDRKEKIVAEKQDLAGANKVSYGKPEEEPNSSEEQHMSVPENKAKETAPSQKKQWVVCQLPAGNIHAFNNKYLIDNIADAKNHATQLSIQHKIPFIVLETVFGVQPKANVDVLSIVD